MTGTLDDPMSDRVGPRSLRLDTDPDVELWWVDLDAYGAGVSLHGLSKGEIGRAALMTSPVDARRFLASRHASRELLGKRLAIPVKAIDFEVGDLGKPFLRGVSVHFNSSRSGGEAAFVLSDRRPVGVDIEVIREVSDAHALAHQHFSERERSDWLQEPDARADAAFLTCWTRKEACAKALGIGLTVSLDSIEVGCHTDADRVAVRLGGNAHRVKVVSVPSLGHGIISVASLEAHVSA